MPINYPRYACPACPTAAQPSTLRSVRARLWAGKYRIDGFLGTGGMGVVLSATHLELDAPVAIKIVRDDFAANEAVVVAPAIRGARCGAHAERPLSCACWTWHVCQMGAPYVVMEKLRGR